MAEAIIRNKPQDESDEFDYEEDESVVSLFIKNILKIAVGVVIIAALIFGGVWAYRIISQRLATPKPESKKNTTQDKTESPNNMPSPTQIITGSDSSYEDNTYKFKFFTPGGWIVFKRTTYDLGYQLGIQPQGTNDIPITVSVQKNQSGFSANDVVNIKYGTNFPREEKRVSVVNAVKVVDAINFYETVILANQNVIYEISSSTINSSYYQTYLALLNNFQIK